MKTNKKFKSKYHFRRYRPSQYHPFLVALVTEEASKNGKLLRSGFNMTRSLSIVMSKRNKYIQITNPNPEDDLDCYLCVDALKNKPIKLFSEPLEGWKLTEEDEKVIDDLVDQKIKKKTPQGS